MASQTAAANIIADAVTSYARKRMRTPSSSKKRIGPKKWAVGRLPRGNFRFTRTVSTGQSGTNLYVGTSGTGLVSFICGATVDQTLQMDFSLSAFRILLGGVQVMAVAVPAYTELGALFDKFRIDAVELFYTTSMAYNGATGVNQSNYMPSICHLIDTDDSNATTAQELQQFGNCKISQLGGVTAASPQRIAKFRPEPAMGMYTNATSVVGAASGVKNLWLDCGTPDIRHYGYKMAIDQINPTAVLGVTYAQLNFQVRYHLS